MIRVLCNDGLIGTGAFLAILGLWRQPPGNPAFHPSFQRCWSTSLTALSPCQRLGGGEGGGEGLLTFGGLGDNSLVSGSRTGGGVGLLGEGLGSLTISNSPNPLKTWFP